MNSTASSGAGQGLAPTVRGEQLLNKQEVCRRLSVSKSTLERLVRDGEMPKPLHVSLRRVAWPASTVDAFIASRRTTDIAVPGSTWHPPIVEQ